MYINLYGKQKSIHRWCEFQLISRVNIYIPRVTSAEPISLATVRGDWRLEHAAL